MPVVIVPVAANIMSSRETRRIHTAILSALALLGVPALAIVWVYSSSQSSSPDLETEIVQACSQCHVFPPPDIKPKAEWRQVINTMFQLANQELLGKYGRPIWGLDPPVVAEYFISRAPDSMDEEPWGPAEVSEKVRFERRQLSGEQMIVERPGGANVQLWNLFEDREGPELVVCDMLSGWVSWTDPADPEMGLQPIMQLKSPCHSELVDLDQDGLPDLLIAELGDPLPSDAEFGAVSLLRQTEDRSFELVRLIDNIGRVADARAADFDGDGKLDIVVGEFGWRKLGSIRYLKNVSQNPGDLRFEESQLDPRHGVIHTPIVDLNGDGHLDIVALISQEFETVTAFLGKGDGTFTVEDVYTAPHPHWGSSGIQVVDFDGDGDLDIILTNGDTLDDMKIKPYHGLQWLENEGKYPFTVHRIDSYPGIHRAEVGDLDGDGDLDIVACSFLPDLPDEKRRELRLTGLVWYERTGKNEFVPHRIVDIRCDFPTLDLGDFDGDGLLDIIIGNLMGTPRADGSEPPLVEIFRQVK